MSKSKLRKCVEEEVKSASAAELILLVYFLLILVLEVTLKVIELTS